MKKFINKKKQHLFEWLAENLSDELQLWGLIHKDEFEEYFDEQASNNDYVTSMDLRDEVHDVIDRENFSERIDEIESRIDNYDPEENYYSICNLRQDIKQLRAEVNNMSRIPWRLRQSKKFHKYIFYVNA